MLNDSYASRDRLQMITIADQLIGEFIAAVNKRFGIPIPDGSIVQDAWPAPHKAKDLPAGVGAVYVFSLPDKTTSVLGSGRVLKVGKVGTRDFAISTTRAAPLKARLQVPSRTIGFYGTSWDSTRLSRRAQGTGYAPSPTDRISMCKNRGGN